MATVLISFIGTGSRSSGQYDLTEYFFKDEENPREVAIFGSALLQHLKDNGQNVEKWLILGTKKSIWSELIKMFPSLFSDDKRTLTDSNYESQRYFLEEQAIYCQSDKEYQSKISQDKLDDWEKIITENLVNTEVKCRKVGYAADSVSNDAIFREILDSVNDKDRIVFDVTHGLRHQPIITSFVIMYLRYLRKITDVKFYYGAKDLDGEVVELDFCNDLLRATEAFAIFNQTGNYVQIGKNLKLSDSFNTKLEKLTFLDEVNKTNPEIPNQLNDEISQANFTPLQKSLANKFKSPLHWASKETLATQLRQKAIFAFERQQYFKATSILLEAVIVAYGEICGDAEITNNLDLHFYRDRAETELIKVLNQHENQTLKNLKKLRNAIAHGTDANGVETEAIIAREAVADENKLKQVFYNGNNLFAKIIKGEIGK
jgi:cell division protein DivIC